MQRKRVAALNVKWLSKFRPRYGQSAPDNTVAGLAFSGDSLALAILERAADGTPRLRHAEALAAQAGDPVKLLRQWQQRYGLRERPVNLVLAPADYRLRCAPLPEVPDGEIADALRWRLQEAVDFPLEEADVEYFYLPAPRRAGMPRLVMAAAARTAAIRRYEDWLAQAGWQLAAIDIPELALREVAALSPDSERGIAVLMLRDDSGIVQMQKGDEIYVSRAVEIGLRHIAGPASSGRSWNEEELERLVVEIQRSMDYFENYYGVPPLEDLLLAPLANARGLAEKLNHALGIACRFMDLEVLLPCAEPLDDAAQQAYLLAVGAALRPAAEDP